MPNAYEEYAAYRRPLTAEQEERLAQARQNLAALQGDQSLTQGTDGDFHSPDGDVPNPLINEYCAIALETAQTQLAGAENAIGRGPKNALPEDADVGDRFPGVDPRGKYSSIDMRFAQRRAVIDAALQARVPAALENVRVISSTAKFRDLAAQVEMVGRQHRMLKRAEKLCHDPAAAARLHTQAASAETDMSVQQYDQMLQGIEHMLGIRQGAPTADVTAFYHDLVHYDLTPERLAAGREFARPQALNIDFPNFDNKMTQRQFARPENWGRSFDELAALPQTEADIAEIDAQLAPYVHATAGRVLDAAFGEQEALSRSGNGLTGTINIDRGDHIIIDGKTPKELIHEQFLTNPPQGGDGPITFDRFYRENGHRLTNELVASALMAGKRVEAFIPDKNGKIPDQPTQITKSGYEPSELRPVTLNRWQRFWGKRGFYKEKVKAAEEYKRFAEARERVKVYNTSGQLNMRGLNTVHTKETLLGEWRRTYPDRPMPEGNAPGGYHINRSSFVSMSIANLIRQGHTIDEIMDPDRLREERRASAEEIYQHVIAQNDQDWIAEMFHDAAPLIQQEQNRTAARLDLTHPEALTDSEHYAAFQYICAAGFDLGQEIAHARPAIERLYGGSAAYNTAVDQVSGSTFYYDSVNKGANARTDLLLGATRDVGVMFANIAQQKLVTQLTASRCAADPNRPFTSAFGWNDVRECSVSSLYGVSGSSVRSAMDALAQEYAAPNGRETIGRQIVDRTLDHRIRIEPNTNRGPRDLEANRFSVVDAKTAQKSMQQAARQQRAPQRQNGPVAR